MGNMSTEEFNDMSKDNRLLAIEIDILMNELEEIKIKIISTEWTIIYIGIVIGLLVILSL